MSGVALRLQTHEEEEEVRKEEQKVAHLRFSSDTKTLRLGPAATGGASGRLSSTKPNWKKVAGPAALVRLGCIGELEEVEEEESLSEMPGRRGRG